MYYKIINGIAVSHQEDINGFSGIWAEEKKGFGEGDLYDELNGWSHYVKTLEEKTAEEKEWRDDELKASDFIVPLTDHPKHAAYMTYRQELRDYPSQSDFPNGTRPVKP